MVLEIYDNLMMKPEAEGDMQFFHLRKMHSEFFAKLEACVKEPNKSRFTKALNELIELSPDQLIAGVTFLMRGHMIVESLD